MPGRRNMNGKRGPHGRMLELRHRRTVIPESLHEVLRGTEDLRPLMHQVEELLLYGLHVLLRQVVHHTLPVLPGRVRPGRERRARGAERTVRLG